MATEILNRYSEQVSEINLHGGIGGAFEISINGEQVYSKLQTKRYPDLGEVLDALKARLVPA